MQTFSVFCSQKSLNALTEWAVQRNLAYEHSSVIAVITV
jgi:hypothetical protein